MCTREELINFYRLLRVYGYNDSHSGNASCRMDDEHYLVTPTGACADLLRPENLIEAQTDESPPPGASLDSELHRQVYLANPEARAVLHSHVPHLVALTMNGRDFIPPDFEGQYYFGRIRVIDLPYEEVLSKAPIEVSKTLRSEPIAVVRGHGAYAQGTSLELAYKWICSAELSARTAWLAMQIEDGQHD
jgi:L-fuculose-phosphate aldolase